MGQSYSKPLTRAQKEALELRKKLEEEKKKQQSDANNSNSLQK